MTSQSKKKEEEEGFFPVQLAIWSLIIFVAVFYGIFLFLAR